MIWRRDYSSPSGRILSMQYRGSSDILRNCVGNHRGGTDCCGAVGV